MSIGFKLVEKTVYIPIPNEVWSGDNYWKVETMHQYKDDAHLNPFLMTIIRSIVLV